MLIAIAGTFFISCNVDEEYIATTSYKEKTRLSHTKFSELIKNNRFSKAYNKVEAKKNIAGKTIMEEQYQFTIEGDIASVVEYESDVFYTLLIKRDSTTTNSFENLIIKNDSLNQTSAFIIKYSYTNENVFDNGFSIASPDITTEITPIIYNATESSGINSRFDMPDCFTATYWICPHPNHTTIASCTHGHAEYETICSFGDGWSSSGGSSGNGSSDGGSSGGGGSDGGSDSTNEDVDLNEGHGGLSTLVVLPEDEVDNPCEKIKGGTSTVEYKQKFKSLNTPAKFNLSVESGFVEKDINGTSQLIDLIPSGNSFLPIPSDSKNGTHVHQNIPKTSSDGINYDGRVKIQSIGDLMTLIRTFQPNNTDPKDAFNVMLSNEGIFAITILESITLDIQLVEKINEFNNYFEDQSKKIIGNLYNINMRKQSLQKMFLKGLKKAGLEGKIGFFEGSIENENASDLNNYKIKWVRKTLNNNVLGVNIVETPCN